MRPDGEKGEQRHPIGTSMPQTLRGAIAEEAKPGQKRIELKPQRNQVGNTSLEVSSAKLFRRPSNVTTPTKLFLIKFRI